MDSILLGNSRLYVYFKEFKLIMYYSDDYRPQLFQHDKPMEEIDLDEFTEMVMWLFDNLEYNKHIEFAEA